MPRPLSPASDALDDALRAADTVDTDKPFAGIQWKNTDACLDVHCACGALCHFDGYQAYRIKCAECGRVYVVGQRVVLVEITAEQAQAFIDEMNSPHVVWFKEAKGD